MFGVHAMAVLHQLSFCVCLKLCKLNFVGGEQQFASVWGGRPPHPSFCRQWRPWRTLSQRSLSLGVLMMNHQARVVLPHHQARKAPEEKSLLRRGRQSHQRKENKMEPCWKVTRIAMTAASTVPKWTRFRSWQNRGTPRCSFFQ